MIFVSTFFDREPKYRKLLNICYNSAKEKMPNTEFHILSIVLPRYGYCRDKIVNHDWDTYYAFMAKISHAIELNDNILMADSDIIFTGSVNSVWQKDFDIAITTRNHKCKYNTGIVFIKPTREAKQFLRVWKQHTREIAKRYNIREFRQWMGIDQASLHKTIQEKIPVKLIELPCHIWNAEQTSWKDITKETKVIHIKSGLRRIYFDEERMSQKHEFLRPILERMRKYENTRERIEFYRPPAVGVS